MKPGTQKHRPVFDDRPFIAWDGEGWTDHKFDNPCDCLNWESAVYPRYPGGCPHHYFLFGNSAGSMVTGKSLSTKKCLDLIADAGRDHPRANHVAFAFEYDVNMILRDFKEHNLRILHDTGSVKWKKYRIEHMPKKWFQVTRRNADGTKDTCRIQDMFSFFAMSFVRALEEWGVGDAETLERIRSGKLGRSRFRLEDMEEIQAYWGAELRLLVELAETLRSRFQDLGLKPTGWYGAGCVAAAALKKHDIGAAMNQDLPEPIIEASCYAYAGGRFQPFRAGRYDGPVYCADINSAYPYALSLLPDLKTGQWIWEEEPGIYFRTPTRIGLHKIKYKFGAEMPNNSIFPAHRRLKDGRVEYPRQVDSWFHNPEAEILYELYIRDPDQFDYFIPEGAWLYWDDGTLPFAWVRDLYDQRRQWKLLGNPAQLPAKLVLNSLYGKLAQRVGGNDGPPSWHQLEWAGHVTSTCRAMLYRAAMENPDSVCSLDTDGVYSLERLSELPNGEGNGLGQWEVDCYDGIILLQSGVYWLKKGDQWLTPKTRGIPRSAMHVDAALYAMREQLTMCAVQNSFIGYGAALMRSPALRGWRTWESLPKDFAFGGNGKMHHSTTSTLCVACYNKTGYDTSLHHLIAKPAANPMKVGALIRSGKTTWEEVHRAYPHRLPWRDTDMGAREKLIEEERHDGIYE